MIGLACDLTSLFRLLARLKKFAEERNSQTRSTPGQLHRSEGSCRLDADRHRTRYKISAKPVPKTPKHSFEANEDDHCETSSAAYDDIAPLMRKIADFLGKSPKDLVIYDPYFCNGAVIRHLAARGFPHVYNKNEDFYRMIEESRNPDYDILVTNPPFSGNHVERMLKFCVDSGKPFLCLVPNYVYTKPFYSEQNVDRFTWFLVSDMSSGHLGDSEGTLQRNERLPHFYRFGIAMEANGLQS